VTTVQNIIDRAKRPMQDDANEMFGVPEVIEYVNEAVTDIAARLHLVHQEAIIPHSSGVIAAPEDLLGWRWIANEAGVVGQFLDFDTWQQYDSEVDPATDFFVVTPFEDGLHLWPVPDGVANFTVGYFGLPAEVTAAGNTIPISRRYDSKIVNYVRSRLFERLGRLEESAGEQARYEDGLPRPVSETTKNSPGEIAFGISLTTFDDDLDAKHR
jgi:hypothetical protein